MKRSFWTLTLAIFIGYSKAGENVLVPPPNLQCACLGDRLRFTCTIVDDDGIGATWWSGTAFTSCDGGRIQLRHSNPNAFGECDGGAISATSLGFEGNCITTELNIVVDSGLNNKTVQCVFASNRGMPTIDVATISLTTGRYEQAPSDVTLSNVSSDGVTFSWSQIDPNCSTVQYQITSDCGNCSLMTSDRSATCSDLQLSTTKRECTFNVSSVICGFTGPPSNPVTVTLKVPDPPQVNLIPVYSSESQSLTSLSIVISSQTDSFVIYEDISGSIMNYTIYFSSGTNSSTISANCTGDGCKSMVEVRPPTVCQPSSSSDGTVSVSAVSRLGPGPPSLPLTLGCTNQFVRVEYDSAASIVTCVFLNTGSQNSNVTCSIHYGACKEEFSKDAQGSTTTEFPDQVVIQNIRPGGSDCYAVRASNDTYAVIVEGSFNTGSTSQSNNAGIVAAVVVPLLLLLTLFFIAIGIILSVTIYVKVYRNRSATPRNEQIETVNETFSVDSPDQDNIESDDGTVSESEDADRPDQHTSVPEPNITPIQQTLFEDFNAFA